MKPWLVLRRGTVLCGVLVFVAGCSSTPSQAPENIDPSSLWRLQWHGAPAAERLAVLDRLGWQAQHSVEGERYRQSLLLSWGQRAELAKEVAGWLAADPENPHLAYLQARLLQDPERLVVTFEDLARRYPGHAWIRLGAAAIHQRLGQWRRAEHHLRLAPEWPDAAEFRALLLARQAAHQGQKEPWAPLLAEALEAGNPVALDEIRRLAAAAGDTVVEERIAAEQRLRHGQGGWSTVLDVLGREFRMNPELAFSELLDALDRWAVQVERPPGFSQFPRHRLPWGIAEILAPEPISPLARSLAAEGHALLLGHSPLRGTELLVLDGVHWQELRWPNRSAPLWVAVADGARSPVSNTMLGGAVFHGFYLRRDLVQRMARDIESRLQGVRISALPADRIPAAPAAGRNALAESWDLAPQLRARVLLEGDSIELLEWRALLFHEAGHLPDTLPLLDGKRSWWAAAWQALGSWWQDGMALGEWEYRAQARALAAGPGARWCLAQIVDTATDPTAPYHRPYRRLLEDLLALADTQGWPPLAAWREVSDPEIAALGRALLEQRGLEAMPKAGVEELSVQLGRPDRPAANTTPR